MSTLIDFNLKILGRNSNNLCKEYAYYYADFFLDFKDITNKKRWYWLYDYYLSNILIGDAINNKNTSGFEKINLIVFNLKSKQIRITINTATKTIYNLSTSRVLRSLGIREKAKKKSNKGERLFIEYLENYLRIYNFIFGSKKVAIFKINFLKKNTNILKTIFKLFNKYTKVISFIVDNKISNNYKKLKKIRSIKKRLKKKIIKDENSFI